MASFGWENIFLQAAEGFTPGTYMALTKVQAAAWSLADVVLVWAFLRIVDLLKRRRGKQGIKWRFYMLYGTAFLLIPVFFLDRPEVFIPADFVVTGLQYALLAYTIVADYRELSSLGAARPGGGPPAGDGRPGEGRDV
jgi:hypothetical protein